MFFKEFHELGYLPFPYPLGLVFNVALPTAEFVRIEPMRSRTDYSSMLPASNSNEVIVILTVLANKFKMRMRLSQMFLERFRSKF